MVKIAQQDKDVLLSESCDVKPVPDQHSYICVLMSLPQPCEWEAWSDLIRETKTHQRRLPFRELCSSSGQTDGILLSTGWGGVGVLAHFGMLTLPPTYVPLPPPTPPTGSCVSALHPSAARSIFRLCANHKSTAAEAASRCGHNILLQPAPGFPPACEPLLAPDEPGHD